MLSEKQLRDAARCKSIKCKQCSCHFDDYCRGIDRAAQTALVYMDMLKRLEWCADEMGDTCPVCGGVKWHHVTCELSALLKEVEG